MLGNATLLLAPTPPPTTPPPLERSIGCNDVGDDNGSVNRSSRVARQTFSTLPTE
jgi:hypothetical protein